MISRGIGIVTYNRANQIEELIDKVLETRPLDCKVVVCDDGSTDETPNLLAKRNDIIYVRGPNKGVAANKNRALFALQDCHFLAILEDDLFPKEKGWFEIYENAYAVTGIHHYCRVQDKQVEETIPDFSSWMKTHNLTPMYAPSPRGDFTFLTIKVVKTVGAFNPQFIGAGYAHGEWSARVAKAGLIPHPLNWVDFEEAADKFYQKGDTDGGRWLEDQTNIQDQLRLNARLRKQLQRTDYIYHPLQLP